MKLDGTGRLTALQLATVETLINTYATDAYTATRYYQGDNPTIIDAAAKVAPDNRIPSPFARKLVNTVKGYMFKPGYITYRTEGNFDDRLKEIFDSNDEELLTAELANDVLVTGRAFEILRMDEDAKGVRMYRVEPGTGAAVYGDDLDKKMIAFVHVVTVEGDTPDTTTKIRTVYYADHYEVWYGEGESYSEDPGEIKDHPFLDVPAVDYYGSMDKLSLFQCVKALIDEHDKILSKNYANDNERFADAYIRALKKLPAEVAAKIQEYRLFDDLGDGNTGENVSGKIDFLTKPDRGSAVAESADRFERLIYDLAMVINPNDLEAGTEITGIAYKLRLLPMEFLAADIEAYFSKGLQRRIKLIQNVEKNTEPVSIHWRRNIPTDTGALLEEAGLAKGILSDETILEMFPADMVPDKNAEIERLTVQSASRLPDMGGATEVDGMAASTSDDAAASGDIQATALNGAQITALIGLVSSIKEGTVTKESALAIVRAAFPLLADDQITAIFASISDKATV